MPAYCFFDVLSVTDPAALDQYREGVLATVEAHGGRYLTVGGEASVVEGDWKPTFPVLIEFPDMAQAHAWYEGNAYRDLRSLRLSATRGNAVFIEGNGFRR